MCRVIDITQSDSSHLRRVIIAANSCRGRHITLMYSDTSNLCKLISASINWCRVTAATAASNKDNACTHKRQGVCVRKKTLYIHKRTPLPPPAPDRARLCQKKPIYPEKSLIHPRKNHKESCSTVLKVESLQVQSLQEQFLQVQTLNKSACYSIYCIHWHWAVFWE